VKRFIKIYLLVVLNLLCFYSSAKESVVINFGISKFTNADKYFHRSDYSFLKADLGVGYQFSFFEVGGIFTLNRYLGHSKDPSFPFSGVANMYSFGVYSKYFWLSHLESVNFFDSYIGAKYLRYIMYPGMSIDGYSIPWTNDPGNIFDLNYGLVFFPLKKLSFYVEYGYSFYPGNKNFIKKDKLNFGINCKFKSS